VSLSASDCISLANVIVLAMTLAVLTWNLALMRKQLRDQHEWYRRSESIRYSGLFHPKVKESRLALDESFNLFTRSDAIPDFEITERINSNRELRLDMNHLLTYYENIAIACMNGIIDEGIIKDMMKGSIIRFKKILSNYIETRRRETNNPRLWINITTLSNKWESEDNNTTTRERLG